MFSLKSQFVKASAALAIIFAVLSGGFFVVSQCHTAPVSITTESTHSHDDGALIGLTAPALLSDLCAGVFFLVLIVGCRFILKVQRTHRGMNRRKFTEKVQKLLTPPGFVLALSLPELGTFRV